MSKRSNCVKASVTSINSFLVGKHFDATRDLCQMVYYTFKPNVSKINSAYTSSSQPGCRGTLGCHLQLAGVPRAIAHYSFV